MMPTATTDLYIIRRNEFFVEVTSRTKRNDGRLKERWNKRKASKILICHECHQEIFKSELYIRDKFWYDGWMYYSETALPYTKVNFICLNCWKGEILEKTSTNWRRNNGNRS